jgi:hypothetical protein
MPPQTRSRLVSAHLLYDVGLAPAKGIAFVEAEGPARTLELCDAAAESVAKTRELLNIHKLQDAADVLVRLRKTAHKRARLVAFLPFFDWARSLGLSFSALADVTPFDWRVASEKNPFFVLSHLLTKKLPAGVDALDACAQLWRGRDLLRAVGLSAHLYALATAVLQKHRDCIGVPLQLVQEQAAARGLDWNLGFLNPAKFDPSFGLGRELLLHGAPPNASNAQLAARMGESADQYRFWMRDELARSRHGLAVTPGEFGDRVAYQKTLDALREVPLFLGALLRRPWAADHAKAAEEEEGGGEAKRARLQLPPVDDDDDSDDSDSNNAVHSA